MGRGRIIKPQDVRLAISDGDYITVKRQLNTGEFHDMLASMAPQVTAGEKVHLESRLVPTAKVVAYLLTWSLTDDDGTPLPMNPDMSNDDRIAIIRALDQDTFKEIQEAIDKHESEVEKEIAASKKRQADESVSSAISLSVVG